MNTRRLVATSVPSSPALLPEGKREQKGVFITLEGIEGAGKSTAIKFIREWLVKSGIPHVITREPGGTEVAEAIRQLILAHHQEPICSDTELLLMFAGRAQHLTQLIIPALERGDWVVCDRFTDATYAYQGGGRGIDPQRIAQIENWVQGDLRPDKVILLDVSGELGMQRISRRKSSDRIEQEKTSFFERARQAYLSRARENSANYAVIDASYSVSRVQKCIALVLEGLVKLSSS